MVHDFSAIQILREIDFGETRSLKTAFLPFVKFQSSKSAKIHKNQDPKLLDMSK